MFFRAKTKKLIETSLLYLLFISATQPIYPSQSDSKQTIQNSSYLQQNQVQNTVTQHKNNSQESQKTKKKDYQFLLISPSSKDKQNTIQSKVLKQKIEENPLEKLSQNPQNAEEFFKSGIAKYKLKDFTGAIADFDKAIDLSPSHGEAYLYRGKCKKQLNDPKSAMADFEKSLELNPNSANYYLQSGLSKSKNKNFQGAIQDYTKAISFNKDTFQAYVKRGDAKLNLGKYLEAIKDYNEAISVKPHSPDAYRRRAYAKFKLKKFHESMLDEEEAKTLYHSQGNFKGYKSAVDSINILRDIIKSSRR
ncbi:MAG: tetratricopeptide repeat protein [Candidatus Caenarcaniphilales bacterium]|nr:tetratricopeptide repeat protein [Candidatus Caenarcaniphilales bacterium]